jgi:hypothetical protein
MPQVVGAGGGLHDDGVAAAQLSNEVPRVAAILLEHDRDRPGHGRDLDRVGEPVVDDRPRAGLRDDLRDGRQSREIGGEPDSLEVDPEVGLRFDAFEIVELLRDASTGACLGRVLR